MAAAMSRNAAPTGCPGFKAGCVVIGGLLVSAWTAAG